MLPIEFSRVSGDGRVTLVITGDVESVPTLWSLSGSNDLECATENLRTREGTKTKWVHSICKNGTSSTGAQSTIREWLSDRNDLDAAIWTALPPNDVDGKVRVMTPVEVCHYIARIRSEDSQKAQLAERYVRNTPPQIDTCIRRRLRSDFGWGDNPLSQVLFEE